MHTDIIVAGVGGQGILSICFVVDRAALAHGWRFKQAEVHGMSQRGGAVQSHLRIADGPIHSDLVPKGAADLVLSVEPLESLRYVEYLSPSGAVVTGVDPVENIPDYPELGRILAAIASLKSHTLVSAERLAREAGSAKAQNMVLLGAASPSIALPVALLEEAIAQTFREKGDRVLKTNLDAFHAGRAAGESYRACLAAGIPGATAVSLVGRVQRGRLDPDAVAPWSQAFGGPLAANLLRALVEPGLARVRGTAEVPSALAALGPDAGGRVAEILFKS